MADISKITLPSGTTYSLKDAWAREHITAMTGISFDIVWDGQSTPTVTNIPAGVPVVYNGTTYTGTKTASTANTGTFYLVYSATQKGTVDAFDEYVKIGEGDNVRWECIGNTQVDLSDLGDLAYKDTVSLSKSTATVLTGVKVSQQPVVAKPGTTTKTVLGSSTTFTVSKPNVTVSTETTKLGATISGGKVTSTNSDFITSIGTPTTSDVLGASTTFTTTVTPTSTKLSASVTSVEVGTTTKSVLTGLGTQNTVSVIGSSATLKSSQSVTSTAIKATASGAAVGANGTANAVTSYPGAFSKLVTTTASKVTAATSQTTATGAATASTTNSDFLKGVSYDSNNETLIFGAATLNTQSTTQFTSNDVTVASGGVSSTGAGSQIMTGLGTASTSAVLTGVKMTAQPTITLAADTATTPAATSYSVVTGVGSITTSFDSKDTKTPITALTPATASVVATANIKTQPTATIISGTTGDVTVVTGATATTSASTTNKVSAVTALGTASTAKALTGVTYTQPTVSITSGNTTGVAVLTSASAALAAAPAVTVGTNDNIAAVTDVAAPTLATNVAVAANGTAAVLKSDTSINVE